MKNGSSSRMTDELTGAQRTEGAKRAAEASEAIQQIGKRGDQLMFIARDWTPLADDLRLECMGALAIAMAQEPLPSIDAVRAAVMVLQPHEGGRRATAAVMGGTNGNATRRVSPIERAFEVTINKCGPEPESTAGDLLLDALGRNDRRWAVGTAIDGAADAVLALHQAEQSDLSESVLDSVSWELSTRLQVVAEVYRREREAVDAHVAALGEQIDALLSLLALGGPVWSPGDETFTKARCMPEDARGSAWIDELDRIEAGRRQAAKEASASTAAVRPANDGERKSEKRIKVTRRPASSASAVAK